ncbi:MAG: Crp/Fnr family transcriptional regulator [Oscillatoriophycideae cyanobacterium NC_groundwater_1537_Pr4_S-0.65um_50_18]|nr:Crp/Fnr family transcriptional regulator [Oscillatoriophycideae cyanobacterium NC_groundwater_1537_Pr4_S-0.65um_50_18]
MNQPMIASSPTLLKLTQPQRFPARAILPSRPNSLWKIKSGFVRTLTWLEDGNNVALGIWGEGDVVGAMLSKADPFQIECLTKVEAIAVPFSELRNATEVLLAHLHQVEALMQIHSHRRIDMVLLKFLEWLDKRFGQDVENGRLLNLRLTHQDIAEAIGSTRVTVTRILNQFERQGVVQCLSLQRIVLHEQDGWHYQI